MSIFAGVLIVAGVASAQTSGTVTSKVGNTPLAGALVTRISDGAQGLTDVAGSFTISAVTGVSSKPVSLPLFVEKPNIVGGYLRFTAIQEQHVSAERIALNGTLAGKIVDRNFEPGSYAINLSAVSPHAGVYITRLTVNGKAYSIKTATYEGKTFSVAGSSETSLSGGATAQSLAKAKSISDSVRVSRFGFKAASFAIADGPISAALDSAGLFVAVDSGTYVEGASPNALSKSPLPPHRVKVSSFLINKYPTTFDDFDAYAVANSVAKPSDKTWGRFTNPVISVSWYDAVLFSNWQSVKDGLNPVYTIDSVHLDTNNIDTSDHKHWTVTANWSANGYRLLTEAEYEYAARGGKYSHGYLFSGSDSLPLVAPVDGTIHPVGSQLPNELGLYNLSGNTGSLLWDKGNTATPINYYASAYDTANVVLVDPRGPEGKYNVRVRRGGGPMANAARGCDLITSRIVKASKGPSKSGQCAGFRLARSN